MSLSFDQSEAHLSGFVGVEDAETLFAWLTEQPQAQLHLSELNHLHAACLQVLMLLQPNVASWPNDADLFAWLQAALRYEGV